MVDEETVRLMIDLAVLPETLADCLALLTGIGEDQAFFATGMFKNVSI